MHALKSNQKPGRPSNANFERIVKAEKVRFLGQGGSELDSRLTELKGK